MAPFAIPYSGLNACEIEQLASCKMPVVKVSKRDLTPVLSQVCILCIISAFYESFTCYDVV